ncbi:MAG: hypothetical protein EOO85_32855 [Pedobacter sp.]|nr:MAG: hypothetical protein EOO85_32855 [Pedobacter sp.]
MIMKEKDVQIGTVKGYLTVVGFYKGIYSKRNRVFVKSKCVCGNEKNTVLKGFIVYSDNISCGCMTVGGKSPDPNRRHDSPEYRAWRDLKDRCYNSNKKDYHRYGGRGITVCDRWLYSYDAFYEEFVFNLKGVSKRAAFVIDETGKAKDVNFKNRSQKGFKDAILKTFSKMPRWKPAKRNGVPIKSTYSQSITFYNEEQMFETRRATRVTLPKPIVIRPELKYEIQIEIQLPSTETLCTANTYNREVLIEPDITVKFHNDPIIGDDARGLICSLEFNRI